VWLAIAGEVLEPPYAILFLWIKVCGKNKYGKKKNMETALAVGHEKQSRTT
jgi:hypothetical protein